MAFQDFHKKLQDLESKEHDALQKHVKSLADISRKEMSKHYATWDANDTNFQSKRMPDKEDVNAVQEGQLAKMVLPMGYAQVMTFVAYNVMVVTQNRRFFELEPTGTEDNPLREPIELILARDCARNKWQTFLIQLFLDIGRFSIGAAEVLWHEQTRRIRLPQTEEVEGAFGVKTTKTSNGFIEIPTFVGNRVIAISPYRILPDTRLPLTRFQEGEFCGCEEPWSMSMLKSDSSGQLFNLDKIHKFTEKELDARSKLSRLGDQSQFEINKKPNMGTNSGTSGSKDGFVTTGSVAITRMVCDIVPANFMKEEGCPLGKENFPIRYIVWLANDKTVIRFEEAQYLHCRFPFEITQFLPDQHRTVNQSLVDVCEPLTDYMTWLMNAHVIAQRNSVDSKWIVDPAGVDVASLKARSPFIFLKKNASQTGVDRYIKQFQTDDPTANAMDDVYKAKDLLEIVTAFSGNMMGQYATGRRSATEAHVVAQGSSARGKCNAGGIWESMFQPMGKQMISNNRQEMDFPTFDRIIGQSASQFTNPETNLPFTNEELFALFKADPVSIATSEDFFVFDSTLPSEKAFLAQSLQEILLQMLQNPQISMVLGYGPQQIKQLFSDIYTLRGVTPSRLPTPMQQPIVTPPSVVPMQPAPTAALPNG